MNWTVLLVAERGCSRIVPKDIDLPEFFDDGTYQRLNLRGLGNVCPDKHGDAPTLTNKIRRFVTAQIHVGDDYMRSLCGELLGSGSANAEAAPVMRATRSLSFIRAP
jgi:hypothetical protein